MAEAGVLFGVEVSEPVALGDDTLLGDIELLNDFDDGLLRSGMVARFLNDGT
jgi:hypothetical protein